MPRRTTSCRRRARFPGKHVGSKDYSEFAIATGHIGIYTGGLAQKVLAPKVAEWMRERGA